MLSAISRRRRRKSRLTAMTHLLPGVPWKNGRGRGTRARRAGGR